VTCTGTTKSGKPCTRNPTEGSERCWQHAIDATPKKWEARFLKAFADRGIVTYSAKAAGVDASTVYRHIKESERFKSLYEQAEEASLGKLEAEMIRRGRDGVKKPVYQGGKKVGYMQEYSDTLLIFALKSRAPHKYRERVEVTGNVTHNYRSELDATLAELLDQFGPEGGAAADAGAGSTRSA
jgi:AcrR family transcriptional regulator